MGRQSRELSHGDAILSNFSLWNASFDERVSAAAAAGFDAIGLYIPTYIELTTRMGRTDAQLIDTLARADVSLAELEVLSGWSRDSATHDQCKRWLETACHIAETFGSRHLAVIGPYSGTPADAARDLRWICDAANDVGLLVTIEFLPFTNIRTAAEALALIELTNRDNLGMTFDTWHHFRGANDWAMLESVPAERVTCIQVNDGTMQPEYSDYLQDTIGNRRLLGEGEFDLRRFFALLEANGITAPVSVEVMNDELKHAPPAESAQRIAASLLRFYNF